MQVLAIPGLTCISNQTLFHYLQPKLRPDPPVRMKRARGACDIGFSNIMVNSEMPRPIYISSQFYYLIYWSSFVIGTTASVIAALLILWCICSNFQVWGVLLLSVMMIMIALLSYPGVISKGVLIKDDRLVIMGIFKTCEFGIDNFKSIERDIFNTYTISFYTGERFNFLPGIKYMFGGFDLINGSDTGIRKMNDLINAVKANANSA